MTKKNYEKSEMEIVMLPVDDIVRTSDKYDSVNVGETDPNAPVVSDPWSM